MLGGAMEEGESVHTHGQHTLFVEKMQELNNKQESSSKWTAYVLARL